MCKRNEITRTKASKVIQTAAASEDRILAFYFLHLHLNTIILLSTLDFTPWTKMCIIVRFQVLNSASCVCTSKLTFPPSLTFDPVSDVDCSARDVCHNEASSIFHRDYTGREMAALKLYFDLMSQPSRAVYMFLKVNQIPFEEKPVALRKGKLDSFCARGPISTQVKHHAVLCVNNITSVGGRVDRHCLDCEVEAVSWSAGCKLSCRRALRFALTVSIDPE